jgi:hypothetical protein
MRVHEEAEPDGQRRLVGLVTQARKQDKRIQVNLVSSEFEIIIAQAKELSETVPAFMRRVVLENIAMRSEPTRTGGLDGLEAKIDTALERFAKLERLQRSILINTSVARSHATAVMEVGEKQIASTVKSHVLDATEKQKAIFGLVRTAASGLRNPNSDCRMKLQMA